MNQLINRDNYLNCYFLTVRAILSKMIEPTSFIWNQSAMIAESGKDTFLFTPYYRSMKEHLWNLCSIEQVDVEFPDFESFYRHLCNILNSGKSILLSSDIYDLPYNLYYQKKYFAHVIEIASVENDELLICDHYYNHVGTVTKNQLAEIMHAKVNREETGTYTFTYYDADQFQFPDVKTYIVDTIYYNTEFVKGNDPFRSYEERDRTKILGYEAFDRFMEYLKEEVFVRRDDIDVSYHCLKELGDSRHNYAQILLDYYQHVPEVERIGQAYMDISNEILVTANMILKCFIAKKFEVYEERVIRKLNNIRDKERRLVTEIENMVFYKEKNKQHEAASNMIG